MIADLRGYLNLSEENFYPFFASGIVLRMLFPSDGSQLTFLKAQSTLDPSR